ncbi:MAG: toxin-antitoxin system HicB family antitoxin [Roseobacter sp.]
METKQIPPFGIRMTPDLHGWVKAEAEKEGRSMNGLIVQTLKEKMNADQNADA